MEIQLDILNLEALCSLIQSIFQAFSLALELLCVFLAWKAFKHAKTQRASAPTTTTQLL